MFAMSYNRVDAELIDKISAVVGAEHVMADAETLDYYKTDDDRDPRHFHTPELVIRPGSAEEIAAVMRLANEYNVPVTVRGGGTGLACGAIAVHGGMVLLMERLNRIIEINKDNLYAVAEAGVPTVELQNEAAKLGLLYAGDPCSSDHCQIGGNLATNAGGNKAVRYGVTRNQVYAIEMVTPTGEIVELGGRLKKCSTGYCMEQLVVGSEGTLGIITKVILKLMPQQPCRKDLLAVFVEPRNALSIVAPLTNSGVNPTSIEYMDNPNVQSTAYYLGYKDAPYREEGIYVIISVEAWNDAELQLKLAETKGICRTHGCRDILDADEKIWEMRRKCLTAAEELNGVVSTTDIVAPPDKLMELFDFCERTIAKYPFPLRINAHIGDGNLHLILLKGDLDTATWERKEKEFSNEVYNYLYTIGGRLSGEHGIGAHKLQDFERYTPIVEQNLMKAIKRAWDPKGILNPGKIFNT